MYQLNISATPDEALHQIARAFEQAATAAIAASGRFVVALSGGSSPKKLYELLAAKPFTGSIAWSKVFFFFGDERYVPHNDKDSNYNMAKQALFDPLQIEAAQIFAVETSLSPEDAAAEYQQRIANFFNGSEAVFDLVLLGLGDNSHTASLFPYTPVLHDTTAGVKSVWLTDQQVFRITLNAPLINKASNIYFLVYGAGKAEAVKHVLEDKTDMENYPAQLILAAPGNMVWFLDEPAAALLSNK